MSEYFVVSNIPESFHSKDLRNYFSSAIESNYFECFHYRHRTVENFASFLQTNKNLYENLLKCKEQYNSSRLTAELSNLDTELYFEASCSKLNNVKDSDRKNNLKDETDRNEENGFSNEAQNIIETNDHEFSTNSTVDFSNSILKLHDLVRTKKKECSKIQREKSDCEIDPIVPNLMDDNSGDKSQNASKRFCCFIKVKQSFAKIFQTSYHKKFWVGSDGEVKPIRCLVYNIQSLIQTHRALENEMLNFSEGLYSSKKVIEKKRRDIRLNDIESMLEMQCSEDMPCGNVGTSLEWFRKALNMCSLSSTIIKRLGLQFRKRRINRYGQVHLDYGTEVQPGYSYVNSNDVMFTKNGHLIPRYYDIKLNKAIKKATNIHSMPNFELVDETEEDGAEVEDWERFAAFHDDVTKQERTKERLFEEDLEVVWEKGGSGLVFHTDAYFWRIIQGEDDDRDVDEWDVDMNPYYGEGGDMDATDRLAMDEITRLRDGSHCSAFTSSVKSRKQENNIKEKQSSKNPPKYDPNRYKKLQLKKLNKKYIDLYKERSKCAGNVQKSAIINKQLKDLNRAFERIKNARSSKEVLDRTKAYFRSQQSDEQIEDDIGTFERHTKGIGRRLLESYGWKDGEGLGKAKDGISNALDPSGQHPLNKKGIGFRAPSLGGQERIIGPSVEEKSCFVGPNGVTIATGIDHKQTELKEGKSVFKTSITTSSFSHELYPYPVNFRKSDTVL